MYIVCATGGLEDPGYVGYLDRLQAVETFNEWSAELVNGPGERVDLLEVSGEAYIGIIDSFVWDED